MWYQHLLRCRSQAEVWEIQGAVESVSSLGYMKKVSPQMVVWSGWHSFKVDWWGYLMIIILVEVLYWAGGPWGGHSWGSAYGLWWRLMMPGLIICSVGALKIIKCGKDIISNSLSWVGIEFLICGGVG